MASKLKTELIKGAAGIRYHVLQGQDLISRMLRQSGVYEPHMLLFSARMLEHLADTVEEIDGTLVDVGANLGSYALPLAKVYTHLSFHCFEPQQPILELLAKNIRENALENVTTQALALSDEAGSLSALLPDYEREPNVGAFSLDADVLGHDYEVKTWGDATSIEVRTLDSFGYRQVRLLKVDVEGMELRVLRGALETLKRSGFPPILFEAWKWKQWFGPRRLELVAWVEGLGYSVESLGAFAHLAQHPGYARVVPREELLAGL